MVAMMAKTKKWSMAGKLAPKSEQAMTEQDGPVVSYHC
jgi:hypothetical protein